MMHIHLSSQRNQSNLMISSKILNLIKKQSIEDNFILFLKVEIIKIKKITFQLDQFIKQEIASLYNIVGT
ncbi:MAG: hypothetical protein CM15mP96_1200 [Gammaproteobacteria bacterium]|nr:MAG: hypothetical protein CM15mP96_1200 [Gammaproteobacteria bacterium]